MTRKLQDIARDYLGVLLDVDDADGDLDDRLLADLDAVEAEFAEKVERALGLAESFDAKASAEKERAAKTVEHARALSNRAARIREWVLRNMESLDLASVDAGQYRAKIARVAPSLDLDLIEFAPWATDYGSEYLTVKPAPEPAPNKRVIVAALKRGEQIPGAKLVTGRVRLAVK